MCRFTYPSNISAVSTTGKHSQIQFQLSIMIHQLVLFVFYCCNVTIAIKYKDNIQFVGCIFKSHPISIWLICCCNWCFRIPLPEFYLNIASCLFTPLIYLNAIAIKKILPNNYENIIRSFVDKIFTLFSNSRKSMSFARRMSKTALISGGTTLPKHFWMTKWDDSHIIKTALNKNKFTLSATSQHGKIDRGYISDC